MNDLRRQSLETEKARRKAEASARAKATFLANMSHEIRTPLNAIIGLSDAVFYERSDSTTRENLFLIHSSSNHLLSVINNILDVSKIDAGKVTVECIDFKLSYIIDQVRTIFINSDAKPDVEVILLTPMNVDYVMNSDPTKLIQVITNLCTNAWKFTEHGLIVVDFNVVHQENAPAYFNVTIKDSGVGMTNEQLSSIFAEFTQADSSITRKYGGTGLGLSISKRLSKILGGDITVESEVNLGSTFTVKIPVKLVSHDTLYQSTELKNNVSLYADNMDVHNLIKADLEKVGLFNEHGTVLLYYNTNLFELDTVIEEVSNSGDRKLVVISGLNQDGNSSQSHAFITKPYSSKEVFFTLNTMMNAKEISEAQTPNYPSYPEISALIVEDVMVNQIVAQRTLDRLHVNHETVTNGKECIERISDKYYDVILLDIQMPVMGGIETIKYIKQESLCQDTMIVALTANTFEEDIRHYYQIGFDDVLSKPFKLEQMNELIKKIKR
ncbi:ATP-binding protein [Vibrio kyushuensis]